MYKNVLSNKLFILLTLVSLFIIYKFIFLTNEAFKMGKRKKKVKIQERKKEIKTNTTLAKSSHFIKNFPFCLIWYIMDSWNLLIKTITPKWILNITDFIFVPIFKFFLWILQAFLSLFGYNFNINNKICYKFQ